METNIAENRYIINVVRMSVMWTAASFCIYLLLYLNKYLPGSIFLNYYLEGATGAIGYLIAAPL